MQLNGIDSNSWRQNSQCIFNYISLSSMCTHLFDFFVSFVDFFAFRFENNGLIYSDFGNISVSIFEGRQQNHIDSHKYYRNDIALKTSANPEHGNNDSQPTQSTSLWWSVRALSELDTTLHSGLFNQIFDNLFHNFFWKIGEKRAKKLTTIKNKGFFFLTWNCPFCWKFQINYLTFRYIDNISYWKQCFLGKWSIIETSDENVRIYILNEKMWKVSKNLLLIKRNPTFCTQFIPWLYQALLPHFTWQCRFDYIDYKSLFLPFARVWCVHASCKWLLRFCINL